MWQRWPSVNIEALTSAVVPTLVLKCSVVPLPGRPTPPPATPRILTDGILSETDYEPKHFCLGSSLVHSANDSCAILLFSFFSLPTFLSSGR